MMLREDKEIEIALEIGRKNARLLPQVERWCRHIKIEQVTAGLLASVYGLPIGTLRVVCPHGISQSESMHLDWEATSFILANCIGCTHHAEVHPDNYGRQVLQEKEEADAKAQELRSRREQLSQQALETAREALETTEITERSVNTLILEGQYDTEQGQRTREQLNEAARLAPEMFSDNAVQVIVDNFTEPSAAAYIACATELCRSRRHVPEFVMSAAMRVVDTGPIEAVDVACSLIALNAQMNGPSTLRSTLPALLQALDRRIPTSLNRENISDSVPGIVAMVKTCMAADPNSVVTQIRVRLGIDDKESRLRTAEVIATLLPDYAEQILSLVPELLTSLELADDPYGESADHRTCEIMAHLYIYSPEELETALEERWLRASDEVRKLLLKVYELIVRHASHADRFSAPVFPKESYKTHLPRVAEKSSQTLADIQLSLSLRQEACRLLDELAEEWPDLLARSIQRLLGRLRMTIQESKNLLNEGSDAMDTLQLRTERIGYNALVRDVAGVLRKLFKANPSGTWPELVSMLNSLDSRQDEALKSELVGSISEFIGDYHLLPEVVPELYKHLVDYQSSRVRSTAICVLGHFLADARSSVPESMIDLLVEVHLIDPYTIIHQAAVAALRSCKFADDRRGQIAFETLLRIEEIYFNEGTDTRFLEELVDVLQWSFPDWVQARQHVVLTILPKYARHVDPRFSERMIRALSRHVEHFPEISRVFLQAALNLFLST
jgi:hypothetical protein